MERVISRSCELNELQVLLKEPVIVYPEKITDHGSLYISPLDKQAPLFMYTLHGYGGEQYSGGINNVNVGVVDVLKRALQQVLMLYYPAAGRIKQLADDRAATAGCNQIIECNGEGVMLVEASARVELKDLGDLLRQLVDPELEKKFVYQLRPTSENPLLVIQITVLPCGGFILGFGWRHELFDGSSVAHFLAAWADVARGTPLSAIPTPNHNRRLLQPQQYSDVHVTADIVDWEQILRERFFGIPIHREGDLMNKSKKQNSWESTLTDFSSSGCLPQYITKMFTVSSETVEALKGIARDGEVELSTCSTFDVITAHVWLSRVKAMEIKPCERILLEFAVDGRPKTIPPLPQHFIGNAFIMASHNCTAGEILGSPLQQVVKKAQLAKANITDDYIKTNIRMLEGTKPKALPSFRETSIVTDWTKFPFDEVDFGWGRALFFTPVAMPLLDVIFVIRSRADGVTVRLGLLPRYMQRFEQLFSDFSTYI